MKPMHFYHEMFKMNYYFCIGWKPEVFQKYMEKSFQYGFATKLKGGSTILCESDQGRIIVIWTHPREKDKCVLAHECVHAACMTLDKIGIDSRNDDGETLAYLVENIMRKALGQ